MLKITRKLFLENKVNMENQIKALLNVPNANIKITKIVVDVDNRVGLVRYEGCNSLLFITDNSILVRNISSWHDISIETVHLKDKLFNAMRHGDKAPGVVEYRFR